MKVCIYMYEQYNERGIKAFEKRVKKFLQNQFQEHKLDVKTVICHNAYMTRANGYGSYNKVAEIEIDGELFTISSHTNDSEMWDNWDEPTSKDKRQMFEAVLSEQFEDLIEQIEQELNS